jgi:hypothetical protein
MTTPPGNVRLSADATFCAKVMYDPGRAANQGHRQTDQKTWTTVPQMLQSKTGIAGLTAATQHYFRLQPVTVAGGVDWSQVVVFHVK